MKAVSSKVIPCKCNEAVHRIVFNTYADGTFNVELVDHDPEAVRETIALASLGFEIPPGCIKRYVDVSHTCIEIANVLKEHPVVLRYNEGDPESEFDVLKLSMNFVWDVCGKEPNYG